MYPDRTKQVLQELEAQVAEFKRRGVQPPPSLVEKMEAQRVRVQANDAARAKLEQERADRDAAQKAAVEARQEAELKKDALDSYLAAGGAPADFEKAWPALRTKIIEQRTLDGLRARPSQIERKRQSGMYG